MSQHFNSPDNAAPAGSRQPFDSDPAQWPVANASATVIGVDFGYGQDHSTVVVVSEFAWQGRPLRAVQQAIQCPLQTMPSDVVELVRKTGQRWGRGQRQAQVVVDARSNMAFFEMLVRAGFTPTPVGVSATSAAAHAAEPTHHVVPVAAGSLPGNRRSVGALIYSLSRNMLVDSFNAHLQGRQVPITDEGHGPALIAEMMALGRDITKARNIIYSTPSGGHDDLLMAAAYGLWALERLPRRRVPLRSGRSKPPPSATGWT